MLLKDDGRHLWSVRLNGAQDLLWTHPAGRVHGLAASPDGRSLAMVVGGLHDPGEASESYLYLMEPDGSVESVYSTHADQSIVTPVFIPPPIAPDQPSDLYWVVQSAGNFDPATGTPVMQVMTRSDGRAVEVEVPLRWGQAPMRLYAYPGGPTVVLDVFRKSDMPSRHALLRNADWWETPDAASPTRLGYWEDVANTDVEAGVAWLDVDTFVAAVGDESAYPAWELQQFNVGCEWKPPRVGYRGQELDVGYADTAWDLLALDEHRILVLGRIDAMRVANALHRQHERLVRWRVLDVRTGEVRETDLDWGQDWAWTVVRPTMTFPDNGIPQCDEQ